jgi:replicative DNA helicase
MKEFIKMPPQVREIEEALIGSLILDPDFYPEISGMIKPEMFYTQSNELIYTCIKSLIESGKRLNLIVLTNELKNSGELDKIGGALHITKLAANGSYNADVQFYAKLIVEAYVKRQMIAKLGDLSERIYKNDEDVENLIYAFQKAYNELETNFDSIDSGTTSKEVAKSTLIEIYEDYEKAQRNESSGISTGFRKLNNLIGGFKPATFVVLAARPGIGKTSVALHFVTTAAKQGKNVTFFTFEMTKEQIFKILISGESEVDRSNIRDGKLNEHELREINSAVGSLEKLPIMWNSKRMNISQLKSIVRKNIRRGKCDMVVVDYLQLIDASDKKIVREQQISEISRELKGMSIEFNIPVIALAQLNRMAEKEVPQLHHLRESGAIEQDADNVIFIYKEVDENLNEINYSLINAKARNGTTGFFEIWHNSQMTKFGDKEAQGFEIQNYYEPMRPNENFSKEPF